MGPRLRIVGLVPVLVAGGCATQAGRLGGTWTEAEPASATAASSSAETSDEAPRLDAGDPTTDGGQMGCEAVDVLFVIDTSGSMLPYWQGLEAAFPGFVGALHEALPPGTDVHVGVTSTSFCPETLVLPPDGGHEESVTTDCSSPDRPTYTEANFVAPDQRTVAGNGAQGRLVTLDGMNHFELRSGDLSTRDELIAWFSRTWAASAACSFEYVAAAAAYAVHPINELANAGFLRDAGAVLLIFVLSDEFDESPQDLSFYRDTITSAKAECGGEACVTTAGLLNEYCTPEDDPFVWRFLNSFGEAPVWGPIGTSMGWPIAPDTSHYPDVVGEALAAAVAARCSEIPPER